MQGGTYSYKVEVTFAIHPFFFTSPDLHTEAFVSAFGAGQLAGGGSMICPKGFLHAWLEYLMTFWADVFYISEIVSAYDRSPYGSNYHPNDKRPPYASDDPEYDREPLQCRYRNSGQNHCPTELF